VGVERITTIITFGLNLLHKNQVLMRTNHFFFIADYYSFALIYIYFYMVNHGFCKNAVVI